MNTEMLTSISVHRGFQVREEDLEALDAERRGGEDRTAVNHLLVG